MIKRIFTLVSAAAIITIAGCAPKEGSPVKSDIPVKQLHNEIVSLKIKPYSVKIIEGYTVNFQVEGIDSIGKKIIISADWKLIGDNAYTGTLDNAAGSEVTFAAGAPGNVILEADYNNLKASAEIEVLKKRK